MKKLLITLAIVMLVSSNAFAFSIGDYRGPLEFKFTDWGVGTLYGSSSGGYGNADTVENAWGVFKVSTIKTADLSATTLWYDGKDGEELTGIYYGLDDDFWALNGVGGINIQSVGGSIDVYLDGTPDFNAAPGPGSRVGTTYPTVTDGSSFLTLAFGTGIKFGNAFVGDDHIVYDNNLDGTTSPFTGDGAFYLNVIGGDYAPMFNSDYYALVDDSGATHYRDFFGQFDTTTTGAGKWLVKSEDPIGGKAVPEPTSMLLFGVGLLGIGAIRRKRAA